MISVVLQVRNTTYMQLLLATSCESEAGATLHVKTLQLMLQLLQKISVYVIMGY